MTRSGIRRQGALDPLTPHPSRLTPYALRLTPHALRLASLLLLAAAAPAAAHYRSISYSTWHIDGRSAQVTVRLSLLDLSRFPWSVTTGAEFEELVGTYLTGHLQLLAGDTACLVSSGPVPLAGPAGRLVYEWRVACPETGALRVRTGLFLDVTPSHLHFARVVFSDTPAIERVLSSAEPTWALASTLTTPAQESGGTSLPGYVSLGLEHILTGYDHLAFLLALLLLAPSLVEVAKVVTGFTLAHSITLALAALGYVRPQPAAIEALIGLSIALVAAENIWLVAGRTRTLPWLITTTLALLAVAAARGHGGVPPLTLAGLALFCLCYFTLLRRVSRPGPLRFAIAFLFGLVHGFAFAGVLVEAGLPGGRLAQALLGFNVGVELGQLSVVALVWPLLALASGAARTPARAQVPLARRLGLPRPRGAGETWRRFDQSAVPLSIEIGSAAVCGLGVFWFVTRAFG